MSCCIASAFCTAARQPPGPPGSPLIIPAAHLRLKGAVLGVGPHGVVGVGAQQLHKPLGVLACGGRRACEVTWQRCRGAAVGGQHGLPAGCLSSWPTLASARLTPARRVDGSAHLLVEPLGAHVGQRDGGVLHRARGHPACEMHHVQLQLACHEGGRGVVVVGQRQAWLMGSWAGWAAGGDRQLAASCSLVLALRPRPCPSASASGPPRLRLAPPAHPRWAPAACQTSSRCASCA
jgi:hypothetical protein